MHLTVLLPRTVDYPAFLRHYPVVTNKVRVPETVPGHHTFYSDETDIS